MVRFQNAFLVYSVIRSGKVGFSEHTIFSYELIRFVLFSSFSNDDDATKKKLSSENSFIISLSPLTCQFTNKTLRRFFYLTKTEKFDSLTRYRF